jgi:hypothetical protein
VIIPATRATRNNLLYRATKKYARRTKLHH